ncbi:unnamed protein product [Prorocentrum cordatum]|uniref:Uncharacterized protein n=1 Tax=Prorocentrum cordatum TaxID=2364126 RepID=A0ABN9S6S7_9DINO|nr:unnamed protein product [Polarella glacialis]
MEPRYGRLSVVLAEILMPAWSAPMLKNNLAPIRPSTIGISTWAQTTNGVARQTQPPTARARRRESPRAAREGDDEENREEEEEEEETAAADLHMPRSTAHQKRWTRGACGHYANIGAKMGGPHHNDRLRTPRSRHRVEKLVLDGDAEADPSREDDERMMGDKRERERGGGGRPRRRGRRPPLRSPKGQKGAMYTPCGRPLPWALARRSSSPGLRPASPSGTGENARSSRAAVPNPDIRMTMIVFPRKLFWEKKAENRGGRRTDTPNEI